MFYLIDDHAPHSLEVAYLFYGCVLPPYRESVTILRGSGKSNNIMRIVLTFEQNHEGFEPLYLFFS